jgi:SAM-dependent methyltransferase
MANPTKWYGMKYPDGELVGLLFRFARPESAGLTAVDVGCGAGRHVRLLDELGYAAVGLDSDPKMVEQARHNGVAASAGDVAAFRPEPPPHLVVAWGLMMLVKDAPAIIGSWRPAVVIADWRSENNDCLNWPGNQPQADGSIILGQPGHTLDGQRYFFHRLEQCELPGYRRVHWQRLAKTTSAERNEWYQTVHRRSSG